MFHQGVSLKRNYFRPKLRTSTSLQLLLQHIWAPYHNRHRHRRHLMRTNVDWHALYDGAISLTRKDKYGNSALWTRLRRHDGSWSALQRCKHIFVLSSIRYLSLFASRSGLVQSRKESTRIRPTRLRHAITVFSTT